MNPTTPLSVNDPTSVFLDRVSRARAATTAILAHLDEHCGVDPENVTWANVGDAGWFLEYLTYACQRAGIKVPPHE